MCVLRGGERPYLYYLEVAANAHMEGDQVPWQPILLEVHLDGNQARFGRPRGSADPTWQPLGLIVCRMVYSLILILILWCILRGGPISSDMWALFVRV